MSEVLTTAEIFERLQQPTVRLGFERAAIEENAQKWTLLCRLESVCEEATQGDCGSFYFCVREDDLKRGDFSRVRVFFQSF